MPVGARPLGDLRKQKWPSSLRPEANAEEHFIRFRWDSVFCHSCNFEPIFNTLGVCLYVQRVSTCLSINKSTGSFGTNIEQSFYRK